MFGKYKFVLCCDNEVQMNHCKDYIDHKILLCFLAKSIPIYIGSKDIKYHFDDKCFINFNETQDINKIKTLLCNDEQYYDFVNNNKININNYSYVTYLNNIKNIINTII